MDKSYEDYIKECWKKAEKLALDSAGNNDNAVVIAFFEKLCSHYHFWRKQ